MAVKTYRAIHNCGTQYKNKSINPTWIAQQYLEMVRDTPNLSPGALIEQIRRDWMVGVSKHTAYQALWIALEMINGKHADQYKYCRDYAAAVTTKNPGSWVKISKNGDFFERMYVRLEACKRGFLAGCRPVISVDACHLKGPFGRQLFCAVGKDANDDMFPITYALYGNECRASWTWFLEMLLDDIGTEDQHRWVFTSDRQKGLLDALNYLVPHNKHRYCLKHLHANLKSHGWKGQSFKDALFACAKSTTIEGFRIHMEEKQALSSDCHRYLDLIPPNSWSRHAFTIHAKSDLLVNSIAETFNAWVLEARDKPVLTMLETIRRMLTNRFRVIQEGLKDV